VGQIPLILVGGFLGSGKTTLLSQAARRFIDRGQRVGLITNDQAADMVDTALLRQQGLDVDEVAGGCFCCRFVDLVTAAESLLDEFHPAVLLGEPVGSCTDLSATVLQPIKQLYGEWFRVAPFTVLADPRRLREALESQLPGDSSDSVLYILRKQLEEADLIVLNKADLLSPDELQALTTQIDHAFPGIPLLVISARTGQGVDVWLDFVMQGQLGGRRIADVDYDIYADGEAALGWLNASVLLHAPTLANWQPFCTDFLRAIREILTSRSAQIAHVKIFLAAPDSSIVGNLTGNAVEPLVSGLSHAPSAHADLTINARVRTDPDTLTAAVNESLRHAAGNAVNAQIRSMQCFRPARPRPTHRYRQPV
jgi:Ni2+-binding GTPase involved in maturation of urease and hydrogenase